MNLIDAKCCETCKHHRYSGRSLSNWCEKHPEIDDFKDTYCSYQVCDDYEV